LPAGPHRDRRLTTAPHRLRRTRRTLGTNTYPTRHSSRPIVDGMSATAPSKPIQTPWGPSRLVERLELRQRAGDRRFSSAVELLETKRGERLVRFAYTTDGVSRRGPVT